MKWLPLSSFINYEIRDPYSRVIGFSSFGNPFILGPQNSEVKDLEGNTIARFKWGNFSFWDGYKDCDLLILSEDENWVIISIVAALIKGLYLQQR